jgi:hypothetical protein
MKLTTTDHDSLPLDFRVQVNPAGLVIMHGQAVSKKRHPRPGACP